MILDLHSHTVASFDGFTSEEELLRACLLRGVDVVAVTEHDRACRVDRARFNELGVEVIPGCEFTTDRGAHIVGLYVSEPAAVGLSPEETLRFIEGEGGIALMPHPWKPGSGCMSVHEEGNWVSRFTFIELINGGWWGAPYFGAIRELANRHDLRMIACSDSHKVSHVGMCVTRIANTECRPLRDCLKNSPQDAFELLVDESLLKHGGLREISSLRKSAAYRAMLRTIPAPIRRHAKLAKYKLFEGGAISGSRFVEIDVAGAAW
jgi:hypothetical protein